MATYRKRRLTDCNDPRCEICKSHPLLSSHDVFCLIVLALIALVGGMLAK